MSGSGGCSCVATKAASDRIRRLWNPQAVIEVGHLHLTMTGRQVKSMNSLEIAEMALVEHAFLFIDVGLAEVAATEHPVHRSRYGSTAIGDRIRNSVLSSSNLITI